MTTKRKPRPPEMTGVPATDEPNEVLTMNSNLSLSVPCPDAVNQPAPADSAQPATLFQHKRSNEPQQVTLSPAGMHTSRPTIAPGVWDAKAGKLEKPAHLQLWSPAVYAPGATRSKDAVQLVTFLVFDLDGTKQRPLTQADRLTLQDVAPKAGLCVVQTTYNHTPDRPRLRIVYALSRHMTAAEHGTVWQYVGAYLDTALGFPAVDPATKDASRLYYVPVVPTQQAAEWYVSELLGGAPLDVDAVLAAAALQPAPQLPAPRAQLPALPAPAPTAAANDNTPTSWEEMRQRMANAPSVVPSKGYRCDDPTHAEASFIDACQRHEIAEQGNGGHSRLLGLANIGVVGYALDPGTAAQIAWEHYNPRCEPPWSDNEFHQFERKFRETKPQGDAQYGYLLGTGTAAPAAPPAPQLTPALQQQAQEIVNGTDVDAPAIKQFLKNVTRVREAEAELGPLLRQYVRAICDGTDSSAIKARLDELARIVGEDTYAKQYRAALSRGVPGDPKDLSRLGEVIAFDDPEVELEYVVDGLPWHVGAMNGLVGFANSGKTPAICALAVALASGTPFMGCRTRKGRVLIVAYESKAGTHRYLRRIARARGTTIPAGSLEIVAPDPGKLLDAAHLDALRDTAGQYDYILIDTYNAGMTGVEFNDPGFANAAKWLEVDNAAVIAVLHTNKSDDGPPSLKSITGTGAIAGALKAVVGLWRPDPSDRELFEMVTVRDAGGVNPPPRRLRWKDTLEGKGLDYELVERDPDEPENAATESQSEKVTRYEAQIPGWYQGRLPDETATLADLKAYCKAESASLVERAAKSLVKQGALEPARMGKKGEAVEKWRCIGGPDRKGFGDKSAHANTDHAPPQQQRTPTLEATLAVRNSMPLAEAMRLSGASESDTRQRLTAAGWCEDNGTYHRPGTTPTATPVAPAAPTTPPQAPTWGPNPDGSYRAPETTLPVSSELAPAEAPEPEPERAPEPSPETAPVKLLRAADITVAELVTRLSLRDSKVRENGFTFEDVERAFVGVLATDQRKKLGETLAQAGWAACKKRRNGRPVRVYTAKS